MKLSHIEDIMAEGKAVIQFLLWLPVIFLLPVASLLQTPSGLQPHVGYGRAPFSWQLFSESRHLHTLSGTGNTSISKEPTECWVNTAKSGEECLGLMIPNWDASVGTMQLNTTVYLVCPSDFYRDGRAPLKTPVVSSEHFWDQRTAGLLVSLSQTAWLICSSAVCQLKCKHTDAYKLDTFLERCYFWQYRSAEY